MLYERQVGSDSIVLTQAERAELEGLARSPKSEHRMRQRAGGPVDDAANRALVGCTMGRSAGPAWPPATARAVGLALSARQKIGLTICNRGAFSSAGDGWFGAFPLKNSAREIDEKLSIHRRCH
jgi:hypothetical protein